MRFTSASYAPDFNWSKGDDVDSVQGRDSYRRPSHAAYDYHPKEHLPYVASEDSEYEEFYDIASPVCGPEPSRYTLPPAPSAPVSPMQQDYPTTDRYSNQSHSRPHYPDHPQSRHSSFGSSHTSRPEMPRYVLTSGSHHGHDHRHKRSSSSSYDSGSHHHSHAPHHHHHSTSHAQHIPSSSRPRPSCSNPSGSQSYSTSPPELIYSRSHQSTRSSHGRHTYYHTSSSHSHNQVAPAVDLAVSAFAEGAEYSHDDDSSYYADSSASSGRSGSGGRYVETSRRSTRHRAPPQRVRASYEETVPFTRYA